MTSRALQHITVPAVTKHTATVIFLHGLGDSGEGWRPVANLLSKKEGLGHIKWVLPHAPTQRVSVNRGLEMPAWFDIKDLDEIFDSEDEQGMLLSASSVNSLIATELDANPNIPSSRIVIGGFSQGAALSLLTTLTSERKLGGAIALSGWLPFHTKIKGMMSDYARTLPIFMGHGTADSVVMFKYGQKSAEYLTSDCDIKKAADGDLVGVTFKSYDFMGHQSSPQELMDIAKFLQKVVPPIPE
jgi:predicted esterase